MIPKECKRLAEVDFPIAEVSRHAARRSQYGMATLPLFTSGGTPPPSIIQSCAYGTSPARHLRSLLPR